MTSNRAFEQRVWDLRADVVHGSSAIARDAADLLADAALGIDARSAAELEAALTSLVIRILDAQPAMASLVTLGREVLDAIGEDVTAAERSPPAGKRDPTSGPRQRAADRARGFGERLSSSLVGAGARAARLLPETGPVLTVSASSSVQAALVAAVKIRPLEVYCLEGRPLQEARSLARALAAEGVRVTLAVDAAAESLLPGCSAVLLGADSIGDGGVVNKIGSAGAARAAARLGLPAYVVADSSKLLPPGFPQPLHDDRPAAEVWSDPGPVRVWNRYFETIPGGLVTRFVLEEGALTQADLERRRQALSVPPALRGWAARQTSRTAGAP